MSDQPDNQSGGTSHGASNQAGGQGQAGGHQGQARGQGQAAQASGRAQQGQYGQGGHAQQRQPPITNVFSRPRPKQYLKFSIGTMAGAGFVLGLLTMLLNLVGGFTMVPSVVQAVQGMSQVSTVMSKANGLTVSYITTEMGAFIALGLALVVVAVIAIKMNDTRRNKITTATSGVFVGGFLFVVISTVITSLLAPSINSSTLSGGYGGGYGAGYGMSFSQSLNFGPLLLDSLVVGIACAVLAAIVVFLADSLPN